MWSSHKAYSALCIVVRCHLHEGKQLKLQQRQTVSSWRYLLSVAKKSKLHPPPFGHASYDISFRTVSLHQEVWLSLMATLWFRSSKTYVRSTGTTSNLQCSHKIGTALITCHLRHNMMEEIRLKSCTWRTTQVVSVCKIKRSGSEEAKTRNILNCIATINFSKINAIQIRVPHS